MKFAIQRASGTDYSGETPPIPAAKWIPGDGVCPPRWQVEVPDLGALLRLVGEAGALIIRDAYHPDDDGSLVIYDDYIE